MPSPHSYYPVHDRVLENASLLPRQTLLDVGCGDGLIAFGALARVKSCKVIFSDISQDLLNHAQRIVRQLNVDDRCQFVNVAADDLSSLQSASVDVVTTRSVLIFVTAKQKSFDEFFRVLKPGGRLSICEPISRFGWPEPSHLFRGYDVTPIIPIVDKVKAVYLRLQPPDTDPDD